MFKKRHFVYARGFSKYFRKFPIAREREREREKQRQSTDSCALSLFWRPDQALDDLAKLWYKRDVYTYVESVTRREHECIYLIIYLFMFVACQYLDEWRKKRQRRNVEMLHLMSTLHLFYSAFYNNLRCSLILLLSININYLNLPISYS